MAQYIGRIRGRKGVLTRLGSKPSGLLVTANGWNDGVAVQIENVNGRDMFCVYRTGGLNEARPAAFLASWYEGETPMVHCHVLRPIAEAV